MPDYARMERLDAAAVVARLREVGGPDLVVVDGTIRHVPENVDHFVRVSKRAI